MKLLKIKKLAAGILAATLAFSLTACSPRTSESTAPSSPETAATKPSTTAGKPPNPQKIAFTGRSMARFWTRSTRQPVSLPISHISAMPMPIIRR